MCDGKGVGASDRFIDFGSAIKRLERQTVKYGNLFQMAEKITTRIPTKS